MRCRIISVPLLSMFAVLPALLLSPGFAQQAAALPASVEQALSQDPPRDPAFPAGMVEFNVVAGGERMPAHAYLAAGAGPHPTVVLLHGLPGNERNLDIAQALRRFGFNSLYFHYRGAWGAEGEFRFTELADDALAVIAHLRQPDNAAALRVDSGKISLLGHSLGGFVALAAGARDERLTCVIALSPANLATIAGSMAAAGDSEGEGPGESAMWASYMDGLFMLAGLSGERAAQDLAYARPSELDSRQFGPGLSGKALLMVVGEQDTVTPPDSMFAPVVAAYQQEAELDLTALTLSGDHAYSWSRLALARAVLGWADTRCR